MDDVRIRPYEPADEPTVRALADRLQEGFAAWRDPAKVERTVRSWVDEAVDAASKDGHVLFVAVLDEGGVIGFIALTAQDHYIDGRDAYIGELAVDPDVEGKGTGRKLLAAATVWAREQGCERLTLQTGAANRRARRFYEQLGFEYEDVSMARSISTE